jgi:hypothetical protein
VTLPGGSPPPGERNGTPSLTSVNHKLPRSNVFIDLAFARYQLKIEPLASAAIEQLVDWMGPTIEHYLTDPRPAS